MNKTKWVIANWKSNKTIAEALDWIAQAGPYIPKNNQLKVIVCPAFSALSEVKKAIVINNFPIMTGAQNLSPFDQGAYTGEEAAAALTELAGLAILGHSERRKYFDETDVTVTQKAKQALDHNIIPLVCVQDNNTPVPKGCSLVAYEPIFAIGTGHTDTPQNADNTAIKLKEKYGLDLQVLYGGSVSSANIQDFILQPNLSGVLIGKSSLNAAEFVKICQTAGENI